MFGQDISISNPIVEVCQTPDACFVAGIDACLRGMGRSLSDMGNELARYIIPTGEQNPTGNRHCYYSDGVLKVLANMGYSVGIHNYLDGELTYDSFLKFTLDNISLGRYLLPWLDNPIYSKDGYKKNHYEQHVVVISGIEMKEQTFRIMDPDSNLKNGHIFDYDIRKMFESLWRRADKVHQREKIVWLGTR